MADEIDERDAFLFRFLPAPAIFSVIARRLPDQHHYQFRRLAVIYDDRVIHESAGPADRRRRDVFLDRILREFVCQDLQDPLPAVFAVIDFFEVRFFVFFRLGFALQTFRELSEFILVFLESAFQRIQQFRRFFFVFIGSDFLEDLRSFFNQFIQ